MTSPMDPAPTASPTVTTTTATTTTTTTMLIVPHTHWDREWYQTFQQFRLRLVRAVDLVLDTLERDPAFTCFMLDGQTIVLEDYLEVRPENAERLQSLARSGRLLTGPWYVQPDEFLAGGESLIRNLQIGRRMAQAYGGAMPVGYLPDSFGHIAQLPQVLRGFGLDNAVFWRGVGPQITTSPFRWAAPDGSEVLAIWLGDQFGYSDGANLPLEAEALAARIQQLADQLRTRSNQQSSQGGGCLLLMNGSDHLEPQVGLPVALEQVNARLQEAGLELRIAALPEYVAYARTAGQASAEPRHVGELRSGRYSPLLPGVLSSRIWLKQRNAACEAVLVRWAEPFVAWAWALGEDHPTRLLQLAWKYLLPNHAHDSICGCGIDQVHREMLPRFDQSEQIASALTEEALRTLATRVDTQGPDGAVPIVVFNPSGSRRTEPVVCQAHLPAAHVELVDAEGHVLPHEILSSSSEELLATEVESMMVLAMMGMVSEGRVMDYTISNVQMRPADEAGVMEVDVTVVERGEPDLALIGRASEEIIALASGGEIARFRVSARTAPRTELRLLARDVPAYGGRVFFLRPAASSSAPPAVPAATDPSRTLSASDLTLENAHLRVVADPVDGTLAVRDKHTDTEYRGLNAIIDGGDVGDLYNYCPPAHDQLVTRPSQPPKVELLATGPLSATLRITRVYDLPSGCTADRTARASETSPCAIVSEVTLSAGARRLDIRTTVENTAGDHRLRAVFPVPFHADAADAEGSFEVARRPARPAPLDAESQVLWIEQPVATAPQKRFVDISDGRLGLAVLNRGLPEYELLDEPVGGETRSATGSAIALTLLRCVDWLSRPDLATRRGHAGPMLRTPEAQGLGRHIFEYALVPHAGAWEADGAVVAGEAQAFEAPLRALATTQHAGRLPGAWSFVSITPEEAAMSAVKRAERGDGIVVRLYNPRDVELCASVALALPFREVMATDLDEEPLEASEGTTLRPEGDTVSVVLRPGEIRTLLFRL